MCNYITKRYKTLFTAFRDNTGGLLYVQKRKRDPFSIPPVYPGYPFQTTNTILKVHKSWHISINP